MRLFVALLGMAMSAALTSGAWAQATFFTVTYVEAVPTQTRQTTRLLKSYVTAGRKDDGNVSFELLKGIHRPAWFTVLGSWKDQEAFETHVAAAHTKEMNEKIKPFLAAPNDTRQHNGLSVAAPQPGKANVCAVTHVDVIPTQRQPGAAAVKQLAEDSRKHAGNLRFDVWCRPTGRTTSPWSSAGRTARRSLPMSELRKPKTSATSSSA